MCISRLLYLKHNKIIYQVYLLFMATTTVSFANAAYIAPGNCPSSYFACHRVMGR